MKQWAEEVQIAGGVLVLPTSIFCTYLAFLSGLAVSILSGWVVDPLDHLVELDDLYPPMDSILQWELDKELNPSPLAGHEVPLGRIDYHAHLVELELLASAQKQL